MSRPVRRALVAWVTVTSLPPRTADGVDRRDHTKLPVPM
jgi:hypothetical protein